MSTCYPPVCCKPVLLVQTIIDPTGWGLSLVTNQYSEFWQHTLLFSSLFNKSCKEWLKFKFCVVRREPYIPDGKPIPF